MPSGHPIKLSALQIENIIAEYNSGVSAHKLATKYGFKCKKSITKIIKNNGVLPRSRLQAVSLAKTKIFTDNEINKIIELNNDIEITTEKIAQQLNCNSYTIKKFLIKLNIYDPLKFDKYLIQKFDIIDTEEKAYWLGFLAADGSIDKNQKQLTLALAIKDKHHLEKFKKFIGINYNICNTTTVINNKIFYGNSYSVSSTNFVKSLEKHNLINNKSFILKFPDTIPEQYIKDYVRGLVDGDGCFCVSKKRLYFSLISSISMCKSVQKILIHNCDIKKTKLSIKNYAGGKMAQLSYCGNRQVVKIAEFLYKNCSICLERKRDLVANFLASNAENFRKFKTNN